MILLNCSRFYRNIRQIGLIVLLPTIIICSISCSSDSGSSDTSPDGTAPIVGNSGIIKVSNVTHNCMTFHITEATDAVTKQNLLTYQVEINGVDSLAGITVNDESIDNFSLNTDTFKVCGLKPDTAYSLDVYVKDAAGNTSSYITFSQKTHPLGVFLLSDINKEENIYYHADTLYTAEINGTVYFNATDGVAHGEELWKYDGTNSPEMVADLNAGPESSFPSYFFTADNKLYFKANDGTGDGLWVYDGNNPPEMVVSQYILEEVKNPYFTEVNDIIYFHGFDSLLGHELFSFDPAAPIDNDNPDVLTNIGNTDFNPNQIVNIENVLYFQGNRTSGDNIGIELFKFDTSTDSLAPLTGIDVLPGTEDSSPNYLTVVDGKLYFKAWSGINLRTDLWQYDPLSENLVSILDNYIDGSDSDSNGNGLNQLISLNNKLYFAGNEVENNHIHDNELWCYNPGEATSDTNPRKIELPPGDPLIDHARPQNLTIVGNFIYFSGRDGTGNYELWRYDSATDATPDLVADLNGNSSSYPSAVKNLNGILYFYAEDYNQGRELWRYDPTEPTSDSNPLMIEIVDGSDGSNPSNLVVQSGKLYFWANDGSHGKELWVTDGEEDPRMLADINDNPVTLGSVPSEVQAAVLNGALYFLANDGINNPEMWRYNFPAITSNPAMMGDLLSDEIVWDLYDPIVLNNTIFFRGEYMDGDEEAEGLWQLSETVELDLVWDYGGPDSGLGEFGFLFSFKDNLYIKMDTPELRVYDTKTPSIAPQVIEVLETAGLTDYYGFIDFNNEIYFGGTDTIGDTELWKYNPNQPDDLPVQVMNLNESDSSEPRLRFVNNNKLYFYADTSSDGNGLFEYTGVGEPIEILDTSGDHIRPLGKGSDAYKSICKQCFSSVGDVIVFRASSEFGDTEIWRYSPGEPAKMFNLNKTGSTAESDPKDIITFNNWVYFSADDGIHGRELWMFDPTNTDPSNIPQLAHDIQPGPVGSDPTDFVVVGNALCFFADDGLHGKEPMCLHAWE